MTPSILIRISMLTGILLFGGLIWFLHSSANGPANVQPGTAQTLLWAGRAIWGMAILGCIVLFGMLQRAPKASKTQTLSIIAWALGEMVALYGGVVWFIGGRNDWYISGVIFLVLSLLAFPGGRAGEGGERTSRA